MAHVLWISLSLFRDFFRGLVTVAFWYFPGGDVMSSFSSPDFLLPQNATFPKRSSDHCHTHSTCSSSCAGPLGRVSTRIPEMSVSCIPRGGCGVYATISQLLQVSLLSYIMHQDWQDLQRSAHFSKQGLHSFLFLWQKCGSRRRLADPHLHSREGC